jgi:hypothetical protein
VENFVNTASPGTDYELSALGSASTQRKFFPQEGPLPQAPPVGKEKSSNWLQKAIFALARYMFYRPIPSITVNKRWRSVVFPTPGVIVIVLAALVFVVLYSFLPQPLFWQSMQYGAPPLAIRSGMLAVALMPWIVSLSMKANFITLLTGIGHERLNVLHRWLAYICMILSIIHTVPFYVTSDREGLAIFQHMLRIQQPGSYIYGTGMISISNRHDLY